MLPKNTITTILRPYQDTAVSDAYKDWDAGLRALLVCQPTGSGKTTVGGKIISMEVERGHRVLVCSHTRKLARQFAHRVEQDFGIPTSVEMGSEKEDGSPVVSATVQTMARRIATGKFHPEEFSLLCFDEAHLALAKSFQKVASHFDKSRILGLTATPMASGKRDLLSFFDKISTDIRIDDLINQGHLSRLDYLNIPLNIRLEKTKKTGDFSEEDVSHAITPYLAACADWIAEDPAARGKCMLAFLPLIATSKEFTRLLCERGVKAEHVDGEMDEAEVESIKKRLEMGTIQCVSCSMLWTVGIDIKPVNLILNLRPTESWVLAVQIWGRGTRLFDPAKDGPPGVTWPAKKNCLLVDPLWLCEKHSLLKRPTCIFARNDDEVDEMNQIISASGGKASDLLKTLGDAREKREKRLRDRLRELAYRKERFVDAMELVAGSGDASLAGYEASERWQMKDVTPGQRSFLMTEGVLMSSVRDFGHASILIDSIMKRKNQKLAGLPDAKAAASMGLRDAFAKNWREVKDFLRTMRACDPLE